MIAKLALSSSFFAIFSFSSVYAVEYKTGYRSPTAEEKALADANMVKVTRVLPNRLALQRVAAERKQAKKQVSPVATVIPAEDGAEISGIKGAFDFRVTGGLASTVTSMAYPRVVDNSAEAWFPAIGDQGGLGSCASFCSTYYTMTSQVARLRGWNVKSENNPAHIFSPRFVYNLINGGQDKGSWHVIAFLQMIAMGSATYADFPYDRVDYKSWPTSVSVWRDALNYRMAQCGTVSAINTEAGLANAKQMLADGYVFNFAAAVLDWQYVSLANDPATAADDYLFVPGSPDSKRQVVSYCAEGAVNHAMTIVGYNDELWLDYNRNGFVDSGEKGALRVANSWGSGWGDGGFTWISYDALKGTSATEGAFVGARQEAIWDSRLEWMSARVAYQPSLVAEVTVTHASRNQMVLAVGRRSGSDTTPLATFGPSGFNGNGGSWAFDGTTTPVEATFAIDCTDLANSGNGNRWFTSFQDKAADIPGTFSKVRFVDSGNFATAASKTIPSGGLPQAVDNGTVHAYADIVYQTNIAPIAKSQSLETIKGVEYKFALEATDANGDPLTYSIVAGPSHGSLSSSGNNRVYTANPTYQGIDVFTFKANDGKLDSNVATVVIRVGTAGSGLLTKFFLLDNNGTIPDLTDRVENLKRVDAQINYATSSDFPSGYVNNFVTRHTGYVNVPIAGSYTFFLTSDDGSKLWLDGNQIVFNDGSHGADEKYGTLTLTAGYHALRVEYCQGGGDKTLVMSWARPGMAKAVVPANVLFHPLISNNTAPVALSQSINVSGDKVVTTAIPLVATDADFDTLVYVTSPPMHGSLFGVAPNLSYLPDSGYMGPDSFTFKVGDGTTDSNTATVSISVVNAPPTVATAAVATPSTVTATTTVLGILGANDGGEDNLIYTWATVDTPPAAVTFSANNTNAAKMSTATFTKAGNYAFKCTIKDMGNLTTTSNVSVTVNQTPAGMAVSPGAAEVNLTKTRQFVAAMVDQFGKALPVQPVFNWSLSNTTSGSLSSAGLFTANLTAGGPYTMTASGGGMSNTAMVTVVAVNIPVGPPGYTWCTGEGGSFALFGESDVAYGGEGQFKYLYKKAGTITYNNPTFDGDPVPGVPKNGFFKLTPVNFGAWAASNNVTGGVNGDSDKDGIANGVEYALQMDPAAADGSMGIFNGNSLSFKKRMTASGSVGLTYRIEVSTDLGVTDPWVELPSTQNAGSIAATMPKSGRKMFARLRVVVTP
jgi:C1A family cysteine protease